MASEKTKLLIETLAGHEKQLHRFYHKCSECFSDTKELWARLAEEEKLHSEWIEKLASLYDRGSIEVADPKLKTEAVNTSIRYIDMQLSRLESGQLTERKALSIALDLERAMIEEDYFRMFTSEEARFSTVMNKLKNATETHKKRLEAAIDKAKRGA